MNKENRHRKHFVRTKSWLYNAERLFFWPLIVLGGKLVGRVIMNLWNIFES